MKNKYVNKISIYSIICPVYNLLFLYKLWKVDNYELATSLALTSEPNNVKLMARVATWVWMLSLIKIYIEL